MVFKALLCILSYLSLTAALMDMQSRYVDVHVIDKKMEPQRTEMTCSGSRSS